MSVRPGERVDPEALRDLCRAELAYYKVPHRVLILPELPKGPTGKILRRDLRGVAPLPPWWLRLGIATEPIKPSHQQQSPTS